MPEIHIKTLQMPSVTLNGVPITFPFKRVDALLYYMVCRKTASRREIVNLLWENSDDETGYKNLRHTLYTLKKTLGVELLVSPHKSTIQLNPDIPITSDYDDFVTNDDFSAYSGAFLHSFSVKNADNFEDWIFATREELQSKYLRGLAEKAQDSLDENKTAAAEKYAFDYLREDPLDERMTVLLMKIYLDTQLYHKATKVYQNFRTQLADELGITPMNETTALYYDIMNRWNSIATQAEDMQKN
ncbi:MAG: BTAD domain-containing putative transcriptional regulator, partial [Oscillospiraceae bacterium]